MNNRDCRPLFLLHLVTIGEHFADKLVTTTAPFPESMEQAYRPFSRASLMVSGLENAGRRKPQDSKKHRVTTLAGLHQGTNL